MVSKIESKCRSGAEYSLSQSSLSITNQNKDYNSNKRIALFTFSSFILGRTSDLQIMLMTEQNKGHVVDAGIMVAKNDPT